MISHFSPEQGDDGPHCRAHGGEVKSEERLSFADEGNGRLEKANRQVSFCDPQTHLD